MITTPKLWGMIAIIGIGAVLAVVGGILHDEALKLSGLSLATTTAGVLIGNGKSARQGETAAPAILPGTRATEG